jgi:hypothetical protein
MDPQCEAARVHLDAAQRAEARAIATELVAIARSGRILPGSIQERHTRCGRANCACHADTPRRLLPVDTQSGPQDGGQMALDRSA